MNEKESDGSDFLKKHPKFNKFVQDLIERNVAITDNTLSLYCREFHNKQPLDFEEVFSSIGLSPNKLNAVLVQSKPELIKQIKEQLTPLLNKVRKEFVISCDTVGFQLCEGKQIVCYSKYDGGDIFVDRESRQSNAIVGLSADGDFVNPMVVLTPEEYNKKSNLTKIEKRCVFINNKDSTIKRNYIEKWCKQCLIPKVKEKKKLLNYNGKSLLIVNRFIFKLMKSLEKDLDKEGIDVFTLPKDYGDENEPIYKMIELCVEEIKNKSFTFNKKNHFVEFIQFVINNGEKIRTQFELAFGCVYKGNLVKVDIGIQKELEEIEIKKELKEKRVKEKKELKEKEEQFIRSKSENVIVVKENAEDDEILIKLENKKETQKCVDSFVDELAKTVEGVPLSLIMCCDIYEPPQIKKIKSWTTRSGRKRKSNQGNDDNQLKGSVMFGANGEGKIVKPLCCVKEIVKKQLMLMFTDKVYFKDTADGYITEECFLLWLNDEIIPFVLNERKNTGDDEQRIVLLVNEEIKKWINEEQMKQYLIKVVFVPKKLSQAVMPLQRIFDCIDEEVINYNELKESVCFTTLDTFFEFFDNGDDEIISKREIFSDNNFTETMILGDQEEIKRMKERILETTLLFDSPITIEINNNIDAIDSFNFDKIDLDLREKRIVYRSITGQKFLNIKNASLQLYYLHLKFPRLISHLFPFFSDLTNQKRVIKRVFDE